ncbi:MAG: UDP-2,4-diacetamido-2,4,6-trideoxy-beta-L-altropyranose hydrolase [Candidatus Micrarchaeota archaeon]
MVKLAFRVNANFNTGSGHLQRCLSLASGLKETEPSYEIFFLTSESSEYSEKINAAGYAHIDLGRITSSYHDAETTSDAIGKHGIDILIVDSYAMDEGYLESIKEQVSLLVVFDDYMHLKMYHAHIIVNPNIYAHTLDYPCDGDTALLLGADYAQLRKEFDDYQESERSNPDNAKHILVTFGGSDLRGGTILTVKALKRLDKRFLATLIIGKAFRDGEALAREIGLDPRFMILQDVPDMAKRMATADIAVASPSTTFYELMLFRIPSILITQADNQEMIAHYAGMNGLAVCLGDISKVDPANLGKVLDRLIGDKTERDRMSARIDGLVDGMGRFRLAEEILRVYAGLEKP